MKAFILTAGHGTRLQPLTYQLPKPMLPIVNRPTLAHIVEHLHSQGVNNLMMNPGYKGEVIEQYFGDGRQFGVSVSYLPEYMNVNGETTTCLRGSASSLAAADKFFDFFDESAFVICGDALIDLDMQTAMSEHKASGAVVSVILQRIDPSQAYKYGIAQLDEMNRIECFKEKPKEVPDAPCYANTGIYIFEPEAVK